MKNIFLVFPLKALSAFFSVLFAFGVHKYIDQKVAAEIIIFYSLFNVGTVLARGGSDIVIMKFFSSDSKSQQKNLVNYIFKRCFIFILFSTLCFLIIYVFLDNFSFAKLFIYLLTVSLCQIIFLLGVKAQTEQRVILSIYCMNIFLPGSFLISTFMLVWFGFDFYIGFFLIISLQSLVIILSKYEIFYNIKLTREKNKTAALNSLTNNYLVAILTQQSLQWLTPVIAGLLVSEEKLSSYFLIHRLAYSIGFFLVVVNHTMLPKLSNMIAKDNLLEGLKIAQRYNIYAFYMSVAYFLVFLFLYVSGKVVDVNFTNNLIIAILFSSQIVNICTGSLSNILNLCDRSRDVRNILLYSLLIFLVITPFLTLSLSYVGLALSSSFVILYTNFSQYICLKKNFGFSYSALRVKQC